MNSECETKVSRLSLFLYPTFFHFSTFQPGSTLGGALHYPFRNVTYPTPIIN